MVIEAQSYGLHPKDLDLVFEELRRGGVGIIPTDSVYAFCCLSDQKSGFESICALKNIDPKDALMSIVCKDLSQASDYFIQWPTPVFRLLKRNLPGPFTFILESGHRAPAFLKNKRKTLGLRIPQHPVVKSIMTKAEMPLIVSSVHSDDDVVEYFEDAAELISRYENQVKFIVIDDNAIQEASTVVDLTGEEMVIIRQSVHELQA